MPSTSLVGRFSSAPSQRTSVVRAVVSALALLPVLAGCSDASPELEETRGAVTAPIVRGTAGTAEEARAFGAVGLIASLTGDRTGYCTGTLVGAHLVLTAGHCQRTGKGPVTHVVFGADIFDAASRDTRPIDRIVRHPTADIALIRFTGDARVDYARANLVGKLRMPLNALSTTVVGFGRRDAQNAQSGGPFQKLEGARIDTIQPLMPIFTVLSPRGAGLCYGDSGGPAFVTIGTIRYQAGVLSNGNTTCRGGDTYVAIPTYEAWLKSTAATLGEPLEAFGAWERR